MAKFEVTQDANGFSIKKGEKYSLTITDTEVKISETSGFACFKSTYEQVVQIKDILFFDYKAKLFGLLGYTFTGGNNSTFYLKKSIKGIKKSVVLAIRQWFIDHGVNFAAKDAEGDTFKPTGFHFFSKEFITLTDKALAHHYNTKFKNRDSIIPYELIDFFLITKAGLCTKRLTVIGALSFSTQGAFWGNSINEVRKAMEAHSLNPSNGKVYHPHLFSGVKGRKKQSLILLEDKIVYIHKEKGEVVAKAIKKVTSYECKPIFSLFKRVATINGYGETDMRTGDAPLYEVVFPGVFFFWWFCCGRIKVACRSLS